MNNDGILEYDGIEDSFADELALDLDEDADNVQITVNFLMQAGLLEEMGENHFLMTEVPGLVGSETASAQRVREHRERQKTGLIESDTQAKSNAQRQKMFRAKEKCKEKQHVPFIEDYINNKRYGGNYYIVIKRDKYKCACCGSIENLCVHHIDGYDESKPENNNANKLITLCRECHSKIHAGAKIEEDILESIDYYSNEMLPSNTDVTEVKQLCNVDIERDKDKEIDKDKIKREHIDYQKIVNMYNDTCVSLPRMTKLTDSRKNKIKARLKTFTIEEIQRAFELAEKSDFLSGKNGKWICNFDWLMKNDDNMSKVLDGVYKNNSKKGGITQDEQYRDSIKQDELIKFNV
jgi:5-methylcytosine-specific restriction endonuclease McrA